MDLADGRIAVKNWFDFINTEDVVDGHWEVKADGRDDRVRRVPGARYRTARGEGVHSGAAQDRRRSPASSTG